MKVVRRLLERWAVLFLTRQFPGKAVLIGRSPPGGWWYAPTDQERPRVAVGTPPKPVMEWSERRLRRWLKRHPQP